MKRLNKIIKISISLGIVLLIVSAFTGVFKAETWSAYEKNIRQLRGYYETPIETEHVISQDGSITVDVKSDDIIVRVNSELTEPKLKYMLDYEDEYNFTSDNNNITLISGKFKFNFWFFIPFVGLYEDDDIIIEIPSGYELAKLTLRTTSGNISLDGVNIEILDEINCTSGNINITNVTIGSCGQNGIKARSGNINIKNSSVASTDNFNINVVSGYASLKDFLSGGSLNITATSGDIRLENCTIKDLSTKATSGNIKITDTKFKGLSHNGHSGNITITRCEFTSINSEITSGNCNLRELNIQFTSISCIANSGYCRLNGTKHGSGYSDTPSGATKSIYSKTTSGNTVFTDCIV